MQCDIIGHEGTLFPCDAVLCTPGRIRDQCRCWSACLKICMSEDGLIPRRQECNIVSNPAVATRCCAVTVVLALLFGSKLIGVIGGLPRQQSTKVLVHLGKLEIVLPVGHGRGLIGSAPGFSRSWGCLEWAQGSGQWTMVALCFPHLAGPASLQHWAGTGQALSRL